MLLDSVQISRYLHLTVPKVYVISLRILGRRHFAALRDLVRLVYSDAMAWAQAT